MEMDKWCETFFHIGLASACFLILSCFVVGAVRDAVKTPPPKLMQTHGVGAAIACGLVALGFASVGLLGCFLFIVGGIACFCVIAAVIYMLVDDYRKRQAKKTA